MTLSVVRRVYLPVVKDPVDTVFAVFIVFIVLRRLIFFRLREMLLPKRGSEPHTRQKRFAAIAPRRRDALPKRKGVRGERKTRRFAFFRTARPDITYRALVKTEGKENRFSPLTPFFFEQALAKCRWQRYIIPSTHEGEHLMELKCPKCGGVILPNDLNKATDLAW